MVEEVTLGRLWTSDRQRILGPYFSGGKPDCRLRGRAFRQAGRIMIALSFNRKPETRLRVSCEFGDAHASGAC
jgi:hypothetical protein